MSILSRFANVFRTRSVDRDIDEELNSHFAEAQAEGREAAQVRRAFGSRLRTREAARDAMVATWLESLVADSRFALRQLRRHRSMAAAAILSLGLGTGACLTVFRLIDGLLLRSLPVSDPQSLYTIGWEEHGDTGETEIANSFDYPGFRKLREAVKDQAAVMAISYPQRINLTYASDDSMERVNLQYVSGSSFVDFGLAPALGRLLTEGDDVTPGAHPIAVISYDYWKRRFGRDPDVLGRKFRAGNDVFEVVGVAPEGFTGSEPGVFMDVYAPTMMFKRDAFTNPNWHWLKVWVRVKPGSSTQLVHDTLRAALFAHRQEQVKDAPAGTPQRRIDEYLAAPVVLTPSAAGVSDLQRNYGRSLVVLALLVAMVLLIACVNVANLMTARVASRARELALRVSIGAGRGRLLQLVIVESAWIACAASALGIAFSWQAAPFVVGMINPVDSPVRLDLPVDARVTAFVALLTLAVTVLFGLAPALRASGVKPASALKGGDRPHSRQRLMNALIAAQVAFCVVVQLSGGLLVATFNKLVNRPLGFAPARVVTLESVSPTGQSPDLWYQVADHLRTLPGVENASVANFALMTGSGWNQDVWANGKSPEGMRSPWFLGVSPGWLETMRIPLLDGRQIRKDDVFPEVGIVNETFSRRYFAGASPVGKTLDLMRPEGRATIQIIGVAADARYTGLRGPIPATVYVPFRTREAGTFRADESATFVVKTTGANPTALAGFLRQEVKRARPEFRVANIRTQDELVRSQSIRERLLAALSVFFGAVALVLAGIGLYGVLHYAVTQRRRELGIRIALGAGAKDIARRVTGPMFAMVALGSAAGLAIGIFTERFIQTLLFGVRATDPDVLLWAVFVIAAAAALAALPVVARAIRIDPSTLLRSE